MTGMVTQTGSEVVFTTTFTKNHTVPKIRDTKECLSLPVLPLFIIKVLPRVLVHPGCHSQKPKTGGLFKQQSLYSHSSGSWESKIKVQVNWFPGEGSLSGLRRATFSMYPHMTEERKQALWSGFKQGHQSLVMTSPKPKYLPGALSPNTTTLGIGASIYELGGRGRQTIQSTASSLMVNRGDQYSMT